ncbi:hypothetical protein Bca52824_020175 [Brassica carinata]|uniref:F-box domain-containing protein n=1 Tax=Brassica carinata TaxID=52824 RepID=A0A8X7VUD8_BRACI|nr:hypothetical protein Bca52824_020175 [Brassica carinata]
MEIAKEKAENQETWRDLPSELLISVMTNLEIEDNVRASAVCKPWHEAAVFVRVTDQPPWLMHFPNSTNSYDFYNPSNSERHTKELPQSLAGSRVRYSKDGWLLMCKSFSTDFVLFNPFTTYLVALPDLDLGHGYQLVGFSSAPTSSDCVVLTIKDYDPGHVTIRTWSPGETAWTSMQVSSQFLDAERNYVVFSNGLFYCLNLRNCVAVFDPSLRKWNVLDVPPPVRPDGIDDESWCEGKFVVGYKGDVFLVCTFGDAVPLVFRLDLTGRVWEKKEDIGSLTMFVSINSCESRTYVHEGMLRNSIYFPKVCDSENRCVTYSFGEGRYHPREHNFNWGKQQSSENIWIEPPENALELI